MNYFRTATIYKYNLTSDSSSEKLHGLNRISVLRLEAGDKIFLQIESDGAIVTGPNSPFIFMGYELI